MEKLKLFFKTHAIKIYYVIATIIFGIMYALGTQTDYQGMIKQTEDYAKSQMSYPLTASFDHSEEHVNDDLSTYQAVVTGRSSNAFGVPIQFRASCRYTKNAVQLAGTCIVSN